MNLSLILIYWKVILEIAILWFVIYQVILFFEGTRAIQVMRGIVIIIVAFFVFQRIGLDRLDWLFKNFFAISVIAALIIFHPEIRAGLARLGQKHIFTVQLREEELDLMLKEISKAAEDLSRDKIGALIVIEKNDPLNAFAKNGVAIDSMISSELIQAVFTPNNPLHDGGMIIQGGRISSTGCFFPLAQNQDLSRIFGTRHRAAIGLSEETDAIIIVVSEERSDISLVYRGKLYKDLSQEALFLKAKEIFKLKV
ncbi:MAG: TIGR00159 family protein [Candidatus Omnitrophica bacterium CG08_land_8_20_14_0_20_41_16]|uniref:Diadenylate cyclase n=1 Tax=Candidatus Sherwoodlollariibacterium unditelluris TaxID=1974757 RepID=A0A2G9YM74_9BACT|nr:MAG: TIGR00159 family protein [Candidatus Omnitrophica bacterium CG23_combo_of_CG06-09_8_20_14_all_41_10]PIS33565.1 MAG: TIGR00159 family protein [Candidatus Omnitrophica bacterium CG08_land_8_20_14_0_20_41_16]